MVKFVLHSGASAEEKAAIVLQSDLVPATFPTVVLLATTSDLLDASLVRVTVEPTSTNGFTNITQIMIDQVITVPRADVIDKLGTLSATTMQRIERSFAVWTGLAG